MAYKKHFIPIESDPEIFTDLTHKLGLSSSLSFQDLLSIHDSEVLVFVPRPVMALILVFPTSTSYEKFVQSEDEGKWDYDETGEDLGIVWSKQTINNACGLYGISCRL
jgi:ubiquitin carboxyl-terminal hydrolase L3